MKKLFYAAILGFILFELANVYFIMPFPGSQEINSINIAYFLYSWRWFFRIIFTAMLFAGYRKAYISSKWISIASLAIIGAVFYFTNFIMAADKMFYQPTTLLLNSVSKNKIDDKRLIIGVTFNGEAKAYPIQFLAYHHQVRDSIAGKPIMITYCNVCRSGMVFEPLVNGKAETFRLIGMDQFNAMFEDKTTKSWWRQATGEAIAGKLKGQTLPEFPSIQTTISKWKELYPNTLIMQADKEYQAKYDNLGNYERGNPKGRLTRRDTVSWQTKSWIVGITVGKYNKAYDWNRLQKERIIYDNINNHPIAVVLSKDNNSFVVLERNNIEQTFSLQNDTLICIDNRYNFIGVSQNKDKPDLKIIQAHQEYWHSWQSFHQFENIN
jgi:hypothetical protein